jgi:hypothetical protein
VLFAITLLAAALSAPQPQVLFAVINRGSEFAIEPVAMVTKTPGPCAGCWRLHFEDALRDDVPDDVFAARYYRHGRTYRVLTGGFDAGTATVEKPTMLGCISLAATVKITPPLPPTWPALAVGSLHVPSRKAYRLEPAAAEEKAMSRLARRELSKRGLPPPLLAKLEQTDFLSPDLNHDGRRDLIGSFEVKDESRRTPDYYRIFLIAAADDAGGYRAEYVGYFRLNTAQNENGTQAVTVVDTLDLDEDGTDEVITSTQGYEGNEYQILKRGHNGKWTIIYRGGGSGC